MTQNAARFSIGSRTSLDLCSELGAQLHFNYLELGARSHSSSIQNREQELMAALFRVKSRTSLLPFSELDISWIIKTQTDLNTDCMT